MGPHRVNKCDPTEPEHFRQANRIVEFQSASVAELQYGNRREGLGGGRKLKDGVVRDPGIVREIARAPITPSISWLMRWSVLMRTSSR